MELIAPALLATLTILGEAEGEPYLGKLAVARVIRNRMALRYASDGTVAGTVFAPFQFSVWNTKEPRRVTVCKADVGSVACRDAAEAWKESGEAVMPDFHDVVLYHTTKVYPAWAASPKIEFVKQIGNHKFYREKR